MRVDYTIHTEQGDILIEQLTKETNDAIVDQLITLRKEQKLTQQDIADQTGINRPNIARIEGKRHATSLECLVRYASCVGKNIEISLVDQVSK